MHPTHLIILLHRQQLSAQIDEPARQRTRATKLRDNLPTKHSAAQIISSGAILDLLHSQTITIVDLL
jgi:hypothetical protein